MAFVRLVVAAAAALALEGCWYGACVETAPRSNATGCWEFENWVWEEPEEQAAPQLGDVPPDPDGCSGELHDFTSCDALGFTEACDGLNPWFARPGEERYVCAE